MIDMMILESHVPMAINQAIARDLGLVLQTNGKQTIAAQRILKGFEPVRSSYRHRQDFEPEAA